MMWWNGDWGWGAWLAMSLGMLAFWGVVAWLVVYAIRTSNESSTRTPEQILSERFASGALTEDEYRDRLTVLRDTTSGQRSKVVGS